MRTSTNRSVLTLVGAAALVLLAGSAAASSPRCCGVASHPHPHPNTGCPEQSVPAEQAAVVEVVFVLDTTGSMGGLIEGAKQKIWSIATRIAQAQPTPKIRMGLVGYRDRGDDYVTKRTELTEDIDAVYAELMQFRAQGGGDTPESVNQALFEAVERFDWSPASQGEQAQGPTLRIIFLVGDAPPKMEYQDDVKYQASAALAREKGILINTIQCGQLSDTTPFWRQIAGLGGGKYFQVQQSGGAVVRATPYDDELARLQAELTGTMVDYGDARVMAEQSAKRAVQREIASAAPASALADRAAYSSEVGGGATLYGRQELVRDVSEGRVDLKDVPAEQLPEPMRAMSPEERRAEIERLSAERARIQARIAELAGQRGKFLAEAEAAAPAEDAFDTMMLEALREQAGVEGITLGRAE